MWDRIPILSSRETGLESYPTTARMPSMGLFRALHSIIVGWRFAQQKENAMRHRWTSLAAIAVALLVPVIGDAACCYFSAKNADILQPAQKVFISWEPATKTETFTVQPKFEGNALDFGMVIPTPSQPKLHEMPRDFFKHLAVYSILKKREMPRSKLLPLIDNPYGGFDYTTGVQFQYAGAMTTSSSAAVATPSKPA